MRNFQLSTFNFQLSTFNAFNSHLSPFNFQLSTLSTFNFQLSTLMPTEQDKEFMREAIRLADASVKNGGGPFGAVIVKDGKVIAGRSNSVTLDHDPTAHAEVNTIREACKKLRTFDLSGCTIYTSCEPCPMCLGAIYWARISRIYYGNTRKDARDIDFADDFIYEELERPLQERTVPITPLLREEALHTFRLWQEKADKTEY